MSFFKCSFPSFLFIFFTSSSLFLFFQFYKKRISSSSSSCSRSFFCSSLLSFSHPYEKELAIALKAIQESGNNLKKALKDFQIISIKGSENDFVTEIDKKNEEIIFSILREAFPNHQFIGEVTFFSLYFLYFTLSLCSFFLSFYL